MNFPDDPRFSAENINAMTAAMDKIIKDPEMSKERKQQMLDATRRFYLGEPTELENELLRMISAGGKTN
jgi:tripartite-type tricarboxylate transporter receptor subunit TctC